MAYTGILVRGGAHAAMLADLPIHREVVVTELGLGVGWDTGSGVGVHWLNYEALSKIGKVAADGSGKEANLKTSNLPILFDAVNGDIQVTTDKVVFKGAYSLPFSLSYIKSMTYDVMTLTDKNTPEHLRTLQLASLSKLKSLTPTEMQISDGGDPEVITTFNLVKLNEFLSGMITKPTSLSSSTTVATFAGISGTIVIEKEDGTVLGQTTTGTTLTYGETLTVGAKVYAYNIDAAKNRSLRVVATVA